MEEKELTIEEKMMKAGQLSLDIARLRKIINLKQREFNKLDTEIYNAQKSKEHESQLPADTENN